MSLSKIVQQTTSVDEEVRGHISPVVLQSVSGVIVSEKCDKKRQTNVKKTNIFTLK